MQTTSQASQSNPQTPQYSDVVFDKAWFEKHQSTLLWLLNNRFTKRWFRWVMRIRHYDCDLSKIIVQITPSSYTVFNRFIGDEVELTGDYRSGNKFANRMFHAFKLIWWSMHVWDLFADSFAPRLSFGFTTLTQYPSSTSAGNPIDGNVGRDYGDGSGVAWNSITGDSGNGVNGTPDQAALWYVSCDSFNTDCYISLYRSILCFDTSSIGSGSTISSATISLWFVSDNTGNIPTHDSITFVDSTPTSTTSLSATDYLHVGSTAQSSSTWNWPVTTGSYSSLNLNATGLGNISKTGVSKYGARLTGDIGLSAPGYTAGATDYVQIYFSGHTGTTSDPKLVVTYTAVAQVFLNRIYRLNIPVYRAGSF